MASIMVVAGESAGDYYPLGRRTTVVGRSEAVAVQLLDERVSRRHLQIRFEPEDGRFYAFDMKSTHGTSVNGRRITGDVALRDGDEIAIGDSRLLFTTQDFPDRQSAMNHFKRVGERGRSTMPGT